MELVKDKSNGTQTTPDLCTLKANCDSKTSNSKKTIDNIIDVTKKNWLTEKFEKDNDPLSIYD